ncbi:MAG: 3-phosphoshikimate 1-carboxyvinyltransferase [Spirochaetales bacterium]
MYPSTVEGEILIPASKSHTIRALLIASMAMGESFLINPLDSEDARSCMRASKALGAQIKELSKDEQKKVSGEKGRVLKVRGVDGIPRLTDSTIDVGNSGTTLYLVASLVALTDTPIRLTGDSQIQARPAGNLLRSLVDLGAKVTYEQKEGFPPFTIQGPLQGGKTTIECPTSQYLSSLLLASPLMKGTTEIQVPLLFEQPYVEMTLRWLSEQHIQIERNGLHWFRIPGRQRYQAFTKTIPGDFSSATFFFCAAAITRSTLTLLGLDMEDTQGDKEVLNILERMGCTTRISSQGITLSGGDLKGIEVDLNALPDALPALAVTACYAKGTTRLVNVPQARLKETDRIAVMAKELSELGAEIKELPDGLEIRGKGAQGLQGGRVNGWGDHRVVMSLAIGALGACGPVTIQTAEAASVTFPGFFQLLEYIRRDKGY